MAVVVRATVIVTQEAHRVIRRNVLGVVLHELLGAVPKRGDGLAILVQAENEAVLLVVLLHDAEGVVVDVAVELDGGLDTPVVLVVEHQIVLEEEAGLESAHVTVADGVAVDNLALSHVLADLLGLVLVDPAGERPVLAGDLAVVGVSGDERRGDLLEGGIERLVVEENPIVVESTVETVLDLANGASNLPDVAVAGQRDKGSVDTGAGRDADQIFPSRIARGHGERKLVGGIVGHRLDGDLVGGTLGWCLCLSLCLGNRLPRGLFRRRGFLTCGRVGLLDDEGRVVDFQLGLLGVGRRLDLVARLLGSAGSGKGAAGDGNALVS